MKTNRKQIKLISEVVKGIVSTEDIRRILNNNEPLYVSNNNETNTAIIIIETIAKIIEKEKLPNTKKEIKEAVINMLDKNDDIKAVKKFFNGKEISFKKNTTKIKAIFADNKENKSKPETKSEAVENKKSQEKSTITNKSVEEKIKNIAIELDIIAMYIELNSSDKNIKTIVKSICEECSEHYHSDIKEFKDYVKNSKTFNSVKKYKQIIIKNAECFIRHAYKLINDTKKIEELKDILKDNKELSELIDDDMIKKYKKILQLFDINEVVKNIEGIDKNINKTAQELLDFVKNTKYFKNIISEKDINKSMGLTFNSKTDKKYESKFTSKSIMNMNKDNFVKNITAIQNEMDTSFDDILSVL